MLSFADEEIWAQRAWRFVRRERSRALTLLPLCRACPVTAASSPEGSHSSPCSPCPLALLTQQMVQNFFTCTPHRIILMNLSYRDFYLMDGRCAFLSGGGRGNLMTPMQTFSHIYRDRCVSSLTRESSLCSTAQTTFCVSHF